MTVDGFWSAFFGAIVVSIVGWIVTWFIDAQGKVERIEVNGLETSLGSATILLSIQISEHVGEAPHSFDQRDRFAAECMILVL